MEKMLVFIVLFGLVYSQGGQQETMSFKSPELTDEEQHSSFLPSAMKCDACTAITYQMTYFIAKAERKTKGKKLKESEVIDLFESICAAKTWENYGLKNVNGVNRISGKGTEADGTPGMMMGGGKWPGRLMAKCHDLVGDLGEDEIYDKYRENKDLEKYLCKEYSNDCNADKPKKKKKKSEL